ncbi:MAG TPA: sulfite exporter TauE/SafE family protein [Moorella mulderi]|nr:sulfite exporter TauE/SafE family protein [Moorella mulderi]
MSHLIAFLVGIPAGIIGGLLGIGGCVLMMPIVRFGFHFDPAAAVGTTLTAVVFTAGSGAYQHLKMKNVDTPTALVVGASGVLGVILGSIVFGYLKPYGKVIDLIVGLAFLLPSLRMLYEGLMAEKALPQPPSSGGIPGSGWAKGLLGSVVGFLTGVIGLGGGYALVPSFIYILRSPVKLAIGTSMASFIWMALVGAAFKFYQQVVDIPTAVCLGLGAVIGAIYGAKMVARVKASALKTLFGAIFLYVSLKYTLLYFGITI